MIKLSTCISIAALFTSFHVMAITKLEAETQARTAVEGNEVLDTHLVRDPQTKKLEWEIDVEKPGEVDKVDINRRTGRIVRIERLFEN